MTGEFPVSFFAKGKGDVDKGTNRKTPGDSNGARPPKKEDYEEARRENNKDKTPKKSQEDLVDNEEKDKNMDRE